MNTRLRALGRLAVYAVLLFGVFPLVGRWLDSVLKGAGDVGYLAGHLVQLAAILLYAAVASKLERRPFGAYGLPWRLGLRSGFWKGAAAGLLSLSLLLLALAAAGALRLRVAPQSVTADAGFGIVYAAVFLLLAVREEFLYRGYGLFTMAGAAGFWPAAAITTLWFAWSHAGRNENPLGLATVALFGLIACLTLRRTGALWVAVGFHAAWDWGQTYLYGVADSGHAPAPGHLLAAAAPTTAPSWLSGGSAGPEGSALCLALFLLIGLACVRFLRGPRGKEALEAGRGAAAT